MLLEAPRVDPEQLRRASGWELKPEGLCKEQRCVPLPAGAVDGADGTVDAEVLSARLGMALVADPAHRLWALGPESGGRALLSARMPELELPDRHGRPFSLHSLRGTRIVMVAWASW